jgi:hypothetical protein
MLMTFAFGLASVFMLSGSLKNEDEIVINLPQNESAEIIEIITKRNWRGFEATGHGCGGRNEYGSGCSFTGYANENFEGVSVSNCGYQNSKSLNREIELRIKDSVKVLEKTDNKQRGTKRIVLENREGNDEWFDIIISDGSLRLKIITARKLRLLDDFEYWEKLADEQLKSFTQNNAQSSR